MTITSGEIGLAAVVGTLVIGGASNWVQMWVFRRSAANDRAERREERLWPERATAYVDWIASNDVWTNYRDSRDATIKIAGQVDPEISPGYFQEEAQVRLRARVAAYSSEEVRALLAASLKRDQGFVYALFMRRDHLATEAGPGFAERSLELFEALQQARADAREADDAVLQRMRQELQGVVPW